jgi:hypothetical protein
MLAAPGRAAQIGTLAAVDESAELASSPFKMAERVFSGTKWTAKSHQNPV